MGIFDKLFRKKNDEETIDINARTVEEFIYLIRVYYQSVMAVNLGITNLNMLPDMAMFKRMLKIPTQNNKPGLAEKSRARKVLMQDYGLNDSFFKEIDASIKKNCKSQQHVQAYFFKFQGFCGDLFNLMDHLMQWKFRLSILVKKMLRQQTVKTVHEIMTKSEWKDVNDQKAAWSVRKYAEALGYSELWITDFVYSVLLVARKDKTATAKK